MGSISQDSRCRQEKVFVDDKFKQPKEDGPSYCDWEAKDSIVMSCLQSMERLYFSLLDFLNLLRRYGMVLPPQCQKRYYAQICEPQLEIGTYDDVIALVEINILC